MLPIDSNEGHMVKSQGNAAGLYINDVHSSLNHFAWKLSNFEQ